MLPVHCSCIVRTTKKRRGSGEGEPPNACKLDRAITAGNGSGSCVQAGVVAAE